MELHQHFMNIAASESSVFEIISSTSILQDSVGLIISKMIEDAFVKLKILNENQKQLKLFRLLLCQQYQLNYDNVENEKIQFHSKFNQFVEFVTNNELFSKTENKSVLYDIMILQLVLFEDKKNFIKLFEDFRANNISTKSEVSNKFSVEYYLKILKCFLEAWEIFYFLNDKQELGGMNITHLQSCKKVLLSSIMYDLQTWIQCKTNIEWLALYSILSKIVNITKSNRILTSFVYDIIDKNFDAIYILCDFIFPCNSLPIEVDYSIIQHQNLLLIIQEKCISTDSQERKKAFNLFKRMIDFININDDKIKKVKTLSIQSMEINPFICSKSETEDCTIKQIRTNFILIMEALEEKQKHLVIPSLSFFDSLLQGSMEHKSCGNCFDFRWIYCILARILAHDNNAIVKWGLLKSLRLNEEAYHYDPLIMLIVKSLNNTFLYENYNNDNEPEIVIALIAWFHNFQSEDLHIIEKFIYFINEVTWGPVAIFYILHSIYIASDKLKNIVRLKQEHLDILKSLVDTNIKLHSPMLRSMSQVTLIKILSCFSEAQNLIYLSNFLSVFLEKDLKEPYCWSALISWLAKVHYDDAVYFIDKVYENLVNNEKYDGISMNLFSLVIQILYEGKIICQTEQCFVTQKLSSLFLCLDKIDVRPYVKVSLIIKIIDLIYCFFDSQRQPPEFIFKLFLNYKENIFKFILKLFYNENFDYEVIKICVRVFKRVNYYKENTKINVSIITTNNFKELEIKCMQVINNASQHNQMQLLLALQLWSSISNECKYEDEFFFKKINYLLEIFKCKEPGNEIIRKIYLDFCITLSKLIKNHVLTLQLEDMKRNYKWLQIMSSIFDAVGSEAIIYFMDIVCHYINSGIEDNEKIENLTILMRSFWNYNFGNKRDKTFWLVIQKITKCVNSLNILSNKCLLNISKEFMSNMLSEGDSLQGLKYILLIYAEFDQYFNNTYFMKVILNGLLHGEVMRRDQRITMQTCLKGNEILTCYKVKEGQRENFEAYFYINRQYNIDAIIRATAVVQLCKVLHVNKKNASLFLPLVLEKLSTMRNKRYYADSQLHRLKQRLMQTLLLLQPYLDKESMLILYHVLRDSFIYDTDQHSVRLMKEWLLIRIYLANENILSDLWSFFQTIYDERPSSMSSVIVIIWHVAQQLNKENFIKFIRIAFMKLEICCMGQQFNMRLFGQVFFIKLYKLLDDNNDIKVEYANVYKAILKSLNSSNFKKNPEKIQENFFYTIFNPLEHYSLETIYHQLPRLSNNNFEECITKYNFEEVITLSGSNISIKITNLEDSLNRAAVPYVILKSSENLQSEEIENTQIITDVQKKIIPWKTMLPNKDDLDQINGLDLHFDTKNKKDITIIATLVDKSQNLGGIARTCEIFGVKELVISNLKQIQDKEFQVLSVSADRWIKIIEVKQFSFNQYLLNLKEHGWTLVGAEQTANSVNLCNYKFPKQTALILGNEKNGISADIIPLLDICIEIPQFGIVRSLNVHVTSAICIWEYVKQHHFVI